MSQSASASYLQQLAKRPNEGDLYIALAEADKQKAGKAPHEATSKAVSVSSPSDLLDFDNLDRGPHADALRALGMRLFWRWSSALHQFACVDKSEDKDLRAQVLHAITGNAAGGAAFLAAFIAVHFKLGAAESALVSALTIRLLGTPALEEVCETWSKTLKNHEGAS